MIDNDEYPSSIVIPDDRIERCGNCVACFRVTNCTKCLNCENKIHPCVKRICIRNGLNTDSLISPSSSTIIISKDENDIFANILPASPKPVVHKIRKIYEKRVSYKGF